MKSRGCTRGSPRAPAASLQLAVRDEVEKRRHAGRSDVRVVRKVRRGIEQPVRAVAGGGALLQVVQDGSAQIGCDPRLRRVVRPIEEPRRGDDLDRIERGRGRAEEAAHDGAQPRHHASHRVGDEIA